MANWDPTVLKQFAAEFSGELQRMLKPHGDVPPVLVDAVRYSALAPGKRIRPFLVKRCCELAGGSAADAMPAAAAIECVHAFSLIHDDLPAMDDDDLRRGQPTSHRKFGEANAILAGDTLAILAFEILATHVDDPVMAVELVHELADASGWSGMIGGQVIDLAAEGHAPEVELVATIHAKKTARIFEAACRMGAISGRGDDKVRTALATFGQKLGCAFQIADDLLDVTAESDDLGKGVRKDAAVGKLTMVASVGIEESRRLGKALIEEAVTALVEFGQPADDLRKLGYFVVDRNY
ncbi:MAG: polyprenyl synthetase family protein [Planctomycetota bacterium]|jgi:geranylgeranyl pyrophosphate synthase